jgi:hypothetical protein
MVDTRKFAQDSTGGEVIHLMNTKRRFDLSETPTIDELIDDWAETTTLLFAGANCLHAGETVDAATEDPGPDGAEDLLAPELLFPEGPDRGGNIDS